MNNIKKLYINKGITSKDVQAYIDWLYGPFNEAISDRIKTLKESLKEAGIIVQEADDDTDEGFEEAPNDADVKEEAPAEDENTEELVEDQPEDEEKKEEDIDVDKDQNLSDAEIKSDSGDIYVNCTIHK